jgi:hypothetical protein
MRFKGLLSVAVLCAVAATAAIAAPSAFACSESSHCYGIVYWGTSGSNYTGGIAYLTASRLSVPNINTARANHEMWVAMNNDPNFGTWVEEGIKDGLGPDGPRLTIFWEEHNTAGQTAAIYPQAASLNTTYIAKISYSGSSSWGVYLNGNGVGGTSHNQPCCAGGFETGTEITSGSATVSGNSTWSNNWGAGSFTQNAPASAGWNTTGVSLWDSAN